MTRAILAEHPLARRSLAPLRDVRERDYGEPLPPIEFPVAAFVTAPLARDDAWALFRELRSDDRLSNVAVTVTTADSEVLPQLFWEESCAAAAQFLAVRASNAEPKETDASNAASRWAKTSGGVRAIARAAAKATKPKADAARIAWSTSLRDPYAASDLQSVYVLDVEPWAAPLALTWLLTLASWSRAASTLRRWHEAHGLRVVALTADTLEAYVERPPATEDELARRLVEAISLCSGHLDEGFAPVVDMLRGHAWQFRFDI